MSAPAANCPNCGAPVTFRWSSAVQTTCEFCHSILVRTDVDLKKVGQGADLPPDASPIQIGTEGAYQNKSFVVIGRIIYEYAQGGWNEWHVVYNDGSNGWLSDAQLEYDLSWQRAAPSQLPAANQIGRGGKFQLVRQGGIDRLDRQPQRPRLAGLRRRQTFLVRGRYPDWNLAPGAVADHR